MFICGFKKLWAFFLNFDWLIPEILMDRTIDDEQNYPLCNKNYLDTTSLEPTNENSPKQL